MGTFQTMSLSGKWHVRLADDSQWEMTLPGSLDENQIGYEDQGNNQWHPDDSLDTEDAPFAPKGPIATRLTRKYTYEGPAWLTRTVDYEPIAGTRVFLDAERARCLKLLVDGHEVPDYVAPSISTPHVFEVTGLMHKGTELTLISDNSYPGLPHDAIVYSSAATDETQTNWNGILGVFQLRTEASTFVERIGVYTKANQADVKIAISTEKPYTGKAVLHSEAFQDDQVVDVDIPVGESEVEVKGILLAEDVKRWDEYEGNLYELSVQLENCDTKSCTFGVREFGDDDTGRLALNGHRIFIRSEANCAEFPETGHPPMTVEAWMEILSTYKSYGVNMMRFHSHCPPEAAFTAADHLGMLMEPELSHWNPKDAFEADEAWQYYPVELKRILETLANHPSFVMLTFGNELWAGELGCARMDQLLDMAHTWDDTRLYANASNTFYGTKGCNPKNDFYTSMAYFEDELRGISPGNKENGGVLPGHINRHYPNAKTNYEGIMAKLRQAYKKPVFGFEVGQFEVLPDFDELKDFNGVTDPANLRLVYEKMIACGLEKDWKHYVEATGELSRIGYREEVEAVMRTPSMSGLSLLGLQDFPGQGTALVGMLNSHLKAKPFDFAKPEHFSAFFRSQLPLAFLEKYTYEATETLQAEIAVANYGKQAITGTMHCVLQGENLCTEKMLEDVTCPAGELTKAGVIKIPLNAVTQAVRLNLTLCIGQIENSYPIWVYPPVKPVCPEEVYQTEKMDAHALEVLHNGGKVFLAPKSTAEALPNSARTQFTTDFWSVGTFPWQSGTMGQLIDEKHPLFKNFPTEFHTNWQWWPMASQRAVILPERMKCIVTELDSYATMRPMAQLLECQCEGGSLLFSAMGLQEIQQYPEARALLNAIYRYMDSDDFAPAQVLTAEQLNQMVH